MLLVSASICSTVYRERTILDSNKDAGKASPYSMIPMTTSPPPAYTEAQPVIHQLAHRPALRNEDLQEGRNRRGRKLRSFRFGRPWAAFACGSGTSPRDPTPIGKGVSRRLPRSIYEWCTVSSAATFRTHGSREVMGLVLASMVVRIGY